MEICLMTEGLAEKINNRAPMADIKAQALKDGTDSDAPVWIQQGHPGRDDGGGSDDGDGGE